MIQNLTQINNDRSDLIEKISEINGKITHIQLFYKNSINLIKNNADTIKSIWQTESGTGEKMSSALSNVNDTLQLRAVGMINYNLESVHIKTEYPESSGGNHE